jgi:tRNA dimethylallyltransferase
MKKQKLYIIIGGPTGVGKSGLALDLCKQIGGEIINADSRQIYKDFNIGTGKPNESYFKTVPHHLFNIISGNERFSAYQFMNLASETIGKILDKDKYPVVVGGTGLYIRALIHGLFPEINGDESIRNGIKERGEKEGWKKLYEELRRVDFEYAGKINPNDKIRIIRALEVYYKSGKPISHHFSKNYSPVKDLKSVKVFITENRKKLYDKINKRVLEMFNEGLPDEVERLMEKGYDENSPAFQSIGYINVVKYLKGIITKGEAISTMQTETRHYAKRQIVWFKKEKGFRHFNIDDRDNIIEYILKEIEWKERY